MFNIFVVSCVYSVVFIFGAIGNLWIMAAMLYSKFSNKIKSHSSRKTRERSCVYIFMLTVADLVVILTVPFSLWQILTLKWVFGPTLCRLHGAIDSSGKSLSIVLLMGMSIERYLLICTRSRYTSSPMRITLIPIVAGVFFGVILPIIPQFMYTRLYTFTVERHGAIVNETVCLHVMHASLVPFYINYTFVCSFAVPLIVMTSCYLLLVRHVRRKFKQRVSANRSPSSSIRTNRPKYLYGVTKSICRIAIFHFTCWAPHWLFTLAPVYASVLGGQFSVESEWFGNAKLYANMLPYINSAGNWILYGLLNHDIRKHIWRPSSRLRFGYTTTTIQSATLSFNNRPSECNDSG